MNGEQQMSEPMKRESWELRSEWKEGEGEREEEGLVIGNIGEPQSSRKTCLGLWVAGTLRKDLSKSKGSGLWEATGGWAKIWTVFLVSIVLMRSGENSRHGGSVTGRRTEFFGVLEGL